MGNTKELTEEFSVSLANVTNSLSSFQHVVKKLELKLKDLEERENSILENEKKINKENEDLEKRATQVREEEKRMGEQIKTWDEKRKSWEEVERIMMENANKIKNKVKLNVGGKPFSTTKDTLLKYKGSYFEYMLTSSHPQFDEDGEFFIDRHPKYFGLILNYLREARLRESDLTTVDWKELQEEFEYFRVEVPYILKEVKLNVGGQQYSTTKDILLQHKGTYFESLLLSSPVIKKEYSIEGNFKYFDLILSFLKNGKLTESELKSVDQKTLEAEFECFKIRDVVAEQGDTLVPLKDYFLRQQYPGLSFAYLHKFQDWLPNKKLTLLFKATRDSFTPSAFHMKCDNKGPTLAIIQSREGFLFGGYTAQTWEGSAYRSDPAAFIFTLFNPHSLPPTKYSIKPNYVGCAVAANPDYLCVFGNNDIRITADCTQFPNTNTYSIFPSSFVDTTGKGSETFTGQRRFTISEIEVYSVN